MAWFPSQSRRDIDEDSSISRQSSGLGQDRPGLLPPNPLPYTLASPPANQNQPMDLLKSLIVPRGLYGNKRLRADPNACLGQEASSDLTGILARKFPTQSKHKASATEIDTSELQGTSREGRHVSIIKGQGSNTNAIDASQDRMTPQADVHTDQQSHSISPILQPGPEERSLEHPISSNTNVQAEVNRKGPESNKMNNIHTEAPLSQKSKSENIVQLQELCQKNKLELPEYHFDELIYQKRMHFRAKVSLRVPFEIDVSHSTSPRDPSIDISDARVTSSEGGTINLVDIEHGPSNYYDSKKSAKEGIAGKALAAILPSLNAWKKENGESHENRPQHLSLSPDVLLRVKNFNWVGLLQEYTAAVAVPAPEYTVNDEGTSKVSEYSCDVQVKVKDARTLQNTTKAADSAHLQSIILSSNDLGIFPNKRLARSAAAMLTVKYLQGNNYMPADIGIGNQEKGEKKLKTRIRDMEFDCGFEHSSMKKQQQGKKDFKSATGSSRCKEAQAGGAGEDEWFDTIEHRGSGETLTTVSGSSKSTMPGDTSTTRRVGTRLNADDEGVSSHTSGFVSSKGQENISTLKGKPAKKSTLHDHATEEDRFHTSQNENKVFSASKTLHDGEDLEQSKEKDLAEPSSPVLSPRSPGSPTSSRKSRKINSDASFAESSGSNPTQKFTYTSLLPSLCKRLNIGSPQYHITPSPDPATVSSDVQQHINSTAPNQPSSFFDGYATFPTVRELVPHSLRDKQMEGRSELAGRLGMVQNCFGRKNCREEISRGVVEALERELEKRGKEKGFDVES